MNLTKHFTWDEVTFSSTALRLGISNKMTVAVAENAKIAAAGMEDVRALLGHPIHVDSWYRSPMLNHAVGGASQSAHMEGFAVDFICPAFGTPISICQAILDSSIAFDKCIQEGSWVHISFDPKYRRSMLTAHFAGGKATYSQGIT